jgi:hypothetical protein
VVREGVGAWGRNDPNLYAHMNNKTIKKKKRNWGLMAPGGHMKNTEKKRRSTKNFMSKTTFFF